MKVGELMVGDWVDVYHELPDESGFYKPLQVTGLHQNDGICFGDSIIESPWNDPEEFEEVIKPISLTEEILEKNGWKKQIWWKYKQSDVVTYDIADGFYLEVTDTGFALVDNCSDDGDYGYISNWIADINYVHELQHALKICENEKEIIL